MMLPNIARAFQLNYRKKGMDRNFFQVSPEGLGDSRYA